MTDQVKWYERTPFVTLSRAFELMGFDTGETKSGMMTIDELLKLVSPSDFESREVKTANYTAGVADDRKTLFFTVGSETLTLPPLAEVSGLTAGYVLKVMSEHADGMTIDPDGSEQIEGASDFAVSQGQMVLVFPNSDASEWVCRLLLGENPTDQLETDLAAAQADIAALQTKAGAVAIFEHQEASGTDGGSAAAGAWTTRTINTEVSDPEGIASVSGNVMTCTVDAEWEFESQFFQTNGSRVRMYDTDGAAEAARGSSAYAASSISSPDWSKGKKVLPAGSYRMDYWATTANTGDGFGRAVNDGGAECYARVTIRAV